MSLAGSTLRRPRSSTPSRPLNALASLLKRKRQCLYYHADATASDNIARLLDPAAVKNSVVVSACGRTFPAGTLRVSQPDIAANRRGSADGKPPEDGWTSTGVGFHSRLSPRTQYKSAYNGNSVAFIAGNIFPFSPPEKEHLPWLDVFVKVVHFQR